MGQYDGFIEKVADHLHIPQGRDEGRKEWCARVLYSLLGRMAYASLWDTQEDGQPTSVVHFKRRIESLLDSYLQLYPGVRPLFPTSADPLKDEIYQIFLSTGQIYHAPNRISPPFPCDGICGDITLSRGAPLNEEVSVSGLGAYKKNPKATENCISCNDMFLLPQNPLVKRWHKVVASAVWSPMDFESQVFFLRTQPEFKYGYWVDKPLKTEDVSLARTGFPGNYIYYLYKVVGSKMFAHQLPVWEVRDYKYRNLANASLAAMGVLPPTQYSFDADIVHLSFGYLPPPAELNLLKLYSWPVSYLQFPSDFNRVMDKTVFLNLKDFFTQQGFMFVECVSQNKEQTKKP